MKIIEKGPGWGIEQTCTGKGNGGGGCGSKLFVEADDIYMTESYDYGGDHDIYYTFKCPVCGIETDVSNLPSAIKNKAYEKHNRHSRR